VNRTFWTGISEIKYFGADTVVRLTADCPLISPETNDRAVYIFEESTIDQVSNKINCTQLVGLNIEVPLFEVLQETWEICDIPEEREHVTLRLTRDDRFKTRNASSVVDYSRYEFLEECHGRRWIADHPEDLEFVRAVYHRLLSHVNWVVN
jgi:spore coat polysaccharide biosynthesis protein SpsF